MDMKNNEIDNLIISGISIRNKIKHLILTYPPELAGLIKQNYDASLEVFLHYFAWYNNTKNWLSKNNIPPVCSMIDASDAFFNSPTLKYKSGQTVSCGDKKLLKAVNPSAKSLKKSWIPKRHPMDRKRAAKNVMVRRKRFLSWTY